MSDDDNDYLIYSLVIHEHVDAADVCQGMMFLILFLTTTMLMMMMMMMLMLMLHEYIDILCVDKQMEQTNIHTCMHTHKIDNR